MSIELIQAAQQALSALEKSQPHPSNPVIGLTNQDFIDHEDTIRQLRAALSQQPDNTSCKSVQKRLEAQQPATGEPVMDVRCEGCGYMTHHREHMGCVRAAKQHTHQAPSVPKDDQIAALVNKVRDIARMFHDHQSLRERIAIELVPALKASQEVKSNAERWRYAIADSGNQTMNFIDIFDDWNGDGSFVEAFDKARLADKA